MGRVSDGLLRKSSVTESLHCSLEVCSSDVVVFNFNDKLTDIMIETSTVLVESTDSSVYCIGTIS